MTTKGRRSRLAGMLAVSAMVSGGLAFLATGEPAGAADSTNKLTVTAGEYAYEFSGAPKPGWVEVEFDNAGMEPHMMAVVGLKKGVTTKQLEAAAMSDDDSSFEKVADPKNGEVFGLPELVSAGQTSTVITKMKPGRYGVLCFLPDAEGTPHIVHGMVEVFDVKGSKSSFTPPSDGVRDVTLTDTGIALPSDGVPRTSTLAVTNDGSAQHSFVLVKLASGQTVTNAHSYFDAWFDKGTKPAGDEPGEIVGGVSTLKPGGSSYLELALEPGHYGYLSAESDDNDVDDTTRGLIGEFDVG